MFCKHCGKQLVDGSRFCRYCGAPVGSAAPRSAPTPVLVPPPLSKTTNDSTPNHVESKAPKTAPESRTKKSKKGLLLFLGIAVAAVIGIGISSALNKPGKELFQTPPVGQDKGAYDRQNEIVINANEVTGSIAPEINMDADRVEGLIEMAHRLEENGNIEAAQAVYALIPKTALGQSVQEYEYSLKQRSLGGVKIYLGFKELKQMYKSIYGEETD